MDQNFAQRPPVRPIDRPQDPTNPRQRPLQVPVRTQPNAAVSEALHHKFGTSLNVPPKYSHMSSGGVSGAHEPAYYPHTFTAPLPLSAPMQRTPWHHTVPFKAALIGVGISLAAVGAYFGAQALAASVPTHVSAPPTQQQTLPIDMTGQ